MQGIYNYIIETDHIIGFILTNTCTTVHVLVKIKPII